MLLNAEPGKTYTVKEINTDDEEMNSFLFRLGCYVGCVLGIPGMARTAGS